MYLAEILLHNLVLGTQILMVAAALYIVYAASRVMHLAVGAVGAAAAYAFYFSLAAGWPLWVGILFGILVAAALGFGFARGLEPFAVRREPLFGLLVNLAMILVIEAVISILFGTDGKSLHAGILPVVSVAGLQVDVPGMVTLVCGAGLGLLLWAIIHFTKAGRWLRGISEDPSLATSLGMNTAGMRRAAYLAAAIVAALVISLTGWHTTLTPTMGFPLIVAAFIAFLVGGASDVRGTVVASYVLSIVPGLIIGFTSGFSENWRLVFVFCLAAVMLSIRPNGLFAPRIRTS